MLNTVLLFFFHLKFPAAMFSTIAPLVRLNPFHAPQLELHQNSCGPRKRLIESEEASCTRRSLAAASSEGEVGRAILSLEGSQPSPSAPDPSGGTVLIGESMCNLLEDK